MSGKVNVKEFVLSSFFDVGEGAINNERGIGWGVIWTGVAGGLVLSNWDEFLGSQELGSFIGKSGWFGMGGGVDG